MQPRDRPVIAPDFAEHPMVALMISLIEQEIERHLEHVGHFEWIGYQLERRLDPADDRQHAITGYGFVRRQLTEHVDTRRRQPDLFGRLAERGRGMIGIAGIESPAGKADLP